MLLCLWDTGSRAHLDANLPGWDMKPTAVSSGLPFVDMLRRILAGHETGELVCSSARGSRSYFLNADRITGFASTLEEDGLAGFLVKHQIITPMEHEVLTSRSLQEPELEKLLVESEIVARDVLARQCEVRALSALIDCGMQSVGHFVFQPKPLPASGGRLLCLSLRQAILEIFRRQAAQEQPPITYSLGGEDTPLQCTEETHTSLQEVSLTPQEGFVLSRLTTPMTLRQLLDIVPFSKPDVLGIINTLAGIGFVTAAAEAAPISGPGQEDTQPLSAIPAPDSSLPARNEPLEKQRLRAETLLRDLQDAAPHQVLGVAENATPADIKAAYHRLAKEFHPDRFFNEVEGTEPAASVRELFEKIHLAYETLKDGAARGDSRAWPHGAKSGSQLAEPTPEEIETSARASHNQGVQHYQQRDFFSAVQHFREAVRMQPAVARYHHSLARALMRNPRWRKEAEEQFLKAIELDEFNADYRVSLGLLYLEGGFPRKAEAQFRDALAWDSENRTAQRELQKLQSLSQPPSWISKFLRKKNR